MMSSLFIIITSTLLIVEGSFEQKISKLRQKIFTLYLLFLCNYSRSFFLHLPENCQLFIFHNGHALYNVKKLVLFDIYIHCSII